MKSSEAIQGRRTVDSRQNGQEWSKATTPSQRYDFRRRKVETGSNFSFPEPKKDRKITLFIFHGDSRQGSSPGRGQKTPSSFRTF